MTHTAIFALHFQHQRTNTQTSRSEIALATATNDERKKFSEILRFFYISGYSLSCPGHGSNPMMFSFWQTNRKNSCFSFKIRFFSSWKDGEAKGVRMKRANYGRHNVDEREKSAKLLPVRMDFRSVKVLRNPINRESP